MGQTKRQMRRSRGRQGGLALLLLAGHAWAPAQTGGGGTGTPQAAPRVQVTPSPALHAVSAFVPALTRTSQLPAGSLALVRGARAEIPFTVAGPRGLVVGQQDGRFEAWVLPVKLLSHFALRANVDGYPVPIELNPLAATVAVYPDRTVITYAHLALTVRQTMFAPVGAEAGTGAVVLFEIEAVRPVELTFSFTPEMRPMWPKPSEGNAQAEWVASAGAYVLHTDFSDLAAAVAIPGAQPGVLAPYQEKPQTHAVEFRLRFDPKRDAGKVYPLLMAAGQTPATASNAALLSRLTTLNEELATLYAGQAKYYAGLHDTLTRIETPNAKLNEDFSWAEIAVEQLRTLAQPEAGKAEPEESLVAGYFDSGDSARPGFGWFFGRDALYTLYAVNGMGDFKLTRAVLNFLLDRQRADGKIMHEYSQTAGQLQGDHAWSTLPYEYAAADATPLFLLAMEDYVQASGDVAFLQAHDAAVKRAWTFERTHDSDGDGIYDNAQGTGWVEDWPGGQPHQEIYLALLDQQASTAVGRLGDWLGDSALAGEARARAAAVGKTIEQVYYLPAAQRYAFSRNANGTLDTTDTLFPAIAWWSGGEGFHAAGARDSNPVLQHASASLRAWDSHVFSTDWGTRDVAKTDPIFDSMSYHRGSVWPLFTGWAAMADYRSGRPLAGFAHLMENAGQTTTGDLGAITELLSGEFFTPFARSTSHQLWSSAMVVTPALRGLFGLSVDARQRTVTVAPRLPAEWSGAAIRQLRVGDSVCDVTFEREGATMRANLTMRSGPALKLAESHFALPAVELSLEQELPLPGSETTGPKVLGETREARMLTVELEGLAGSTARVLVRANGKGLQVAGDGVALGEEAGSGVRRGTVAFGPGEGYVEKTIVLRW